MNVVASAGQSNVQLNIDSAKSQLKHGDYFEMLYIIGSGVSDPNKTVSISISIGSEVGTGLDGCTMHNIRNTFIALFIVWRAAQ